MLRDGRRACGDGIVEAFIWREAYLMRKYAELSESCDWDDGLQGCTMPEIDDPCHCVPFRKYVSRASVSNIKGHGLTSHFKAIQVIKSALLFNRLFSFSLLNQFRHADAPEKEEITEIKHPLEPHTLHPSGCPWHYRAYVEPSGGWGSFLWAGWAMYLCNVSQMFVIISHA